MYMSMKGGVNTTSFEAIGVTRYVPGQGKTHRPGGLAGDVW